MEIVVERGVQAVSVHLKDGHVFCRRGSFYPRERKANVRSFGNPFAAGPQPPSLLEGSTHQSQCLNLCPVIWTPEQLENWRVYAEEKIPLTFMVAKL